jgi:large subunit ribosomal protein L23
METFEILLRPILSEKAVMISEKQGVYTFEVAKDANKHQIKKAVQDAYGVNVESVNTINCIGKVKTRNTKKGPVSGRKSNYKKAIVKLTAGEVLDIYNVDAEVEEAAQ